MLANLAALCLFFQLFWFIRQLLHSDKKGPARGQKKALFLDSAFKRRMNDFLYLANSSTLPGWRNGLCGAGIG